MKKKNSNGNVHKLSLIIINLVIIFILVITLNVSSKQTSKKQYDHNVIELANSNDNVTKQLELYFINQYNNLIDKQKYLQNETKNFDIDSGMNYLSESNSNEMQLFQIVECLTSYRDENGNITHEQTGTGIGRKYYSTYQDENGNKSIKRDLFYNSLSMVSFNDNSYVDINVNLINTTGQITIPFTYYVNGEKRLTPNGIALYTTLVFPNSTEKYLLFCCVAFEDIMSDGIPTLNYDGIDSILINNSGRFISKTDNYLNGTNNTYWSYLKEIYGSESLVPGQIRKIIEENDSGQLNILTGRGNRRIEALLTYNKLENTADWKYISIVPITSLQTKQTWTYAIIILIFVALLMLLDGLVIARFSKNLKISFVQTKEAVISANKANISKSQFLSRMSHEIRTPLNAIIGYNTIAKESISNDHNDKEKIQDEMKVLDCLEKSGIASKHLLTIINDILDMSAIDSGKVKLAHDVFDFKGMITSLTTIFYTQAKLKGVNFDVIFSSLTKEWFVGDQMRTNQILTNLLSNAIKFTHEGGSVVLKITQPEYETNAEHIHFEISDTGIGMDKEYLNHIWSPYEQADSSISRRFGGTGLGLTITKNLIELMGGAITVDSELGVGTKFDVDLIFEKAPDINYSKSYDFSNVNALVVDDDLSTCDYIRLLFTRCNAKCTTVTSGEEAITAVTNALKTEPYTLCLVDWRMPDMDGLETIERIRKKLGDSLPIVVISAYDYTEISDKAMKLGVNKFIAKPLFQSSLFDLLVDVSGMSKEKKVIKEDNIKFKGQKVILAEDNIMNMEIAYHIISGSGLKVNKVFNGKDAIETFINSSPGTYCAILMDIHMPELDGLEATRIIRASNHPEGKTIPIIAMTADAFAEDIAESKSAGMNEHISKPINIEILFKVLSKYIK